MRPDDGIDEELAFLQEILDRAGDAEVATDELATIELLREEGAVTTPRPRYERRGPVLTKVAAAGLATFPAALAPLPALAAPTPLPPSLAIAMATRPPAPPAAQAPKDLFPFSPQMHDVQARARLGLPAAHTSLLAAHPAPMALPHHPVQAHSHHQQQAAATGFQLNPRLKRVFTQQRTVALTTKRQLAANFYQVSQGDSLYSIAADLLGSGTRWREIYNANHGKIGAGYTLRPGQRLTIPAQRAVPDAQLAHFRKGQPANSPALATLANGNKYMVATGDNLYSIAAKRLHNPQRWREIVALNKALLNGKTVIYPNQWLQLPSVNA
jgi:nucleoid-associated protein YgaU